jgi:hypothetical protein
MPIIYLAIEKYFYLEPSPQLLVKLRHDFLPIKTVSKSRTNAAPLLLVRFLFSSTLVFGLIKKNA